MKPMNTWMNGRIIPWRQSVLHVSSDAVLRGASVFEGIRAYRCASGDNLVLFRAADHMTRLFATSMRVVRLELQYSADELVDAVCDLLRANEVRDDAHIRVVAYFDEVDYVRNRDLEGATGAFILIYPGPRTQPFDTGIRCTVSMWRRLSENAMSPRVKASANYLNGRVATVDARLKGFDLPILLSEHGKVSEGPGQNVFLVRNGSLVTPRKTDAILEGVTRDTVMRLAGQLGLGLEERAVDPTELLVADEVFLVGTLAEVLPVTEVDNYRLGDGQPGPITRRIQSAYDDLVRGAGDAPADWHTPVYAGTGDAARPQTPE
jgi:branched-chain amino acid aminotransferase